MFEDVVCSEVHHDQLYQSYIDTDIFGDSGNNDTIEDSRKCHIAYHKICIMIAFWKFVGRFCRSPRLHQHLSNVPNARRGLGKGQIVWNNIKQVTSSERWHWHLFHSCLAFSSFSFYLHFPRRFASLERSAYSGRLPLSPPCRTRYGKRQSYWACCRHGDHFNRQCGAWGQERLVYRCMLRQLDMISSIILQ